MGDSGQVRKRAKEAEAAGRDDDVISTTSSESVNLKRNVGLAGGISFIVGIVIGSGIFISPKGVARRSGSVGLSLISWTICGIISMGGALSYAELGTVIPESGGEHAYLLQSFRAIPAFLFAWVTVVLIRPAAISAVSLTCAEYIMVEFFDDGCGDSPIWYRRMTAIIIILLVMAINIYSSELASAIQIIFTIAKVLALLIIIVGGIVRLIQGHTEHLRTGFDNSESNAGLIALGLYQGMWAYEGWNNLNYVTEELINPSRNLPLSICLGVPLVIVVYLLTNISYFTVMSIDELLDSPAVASTWAETVIPPVAWIIPLSVALSTFGGANGSMFTSSRITFAAARVKHMPKVLTMISAQQMTPVTSLIFMTIVSVFYTLVGNISSLIDYLNFARWIFYGICMGSLFYFRWKLKDRPRPFKVPLIIPLFVMASAVFLVFVPIAMEPQIEFLYATLVIVGGLVLYFPFVYFEWDIPGIKYFNMAAQLATQSCIPEYQLLTEKKVEYYNEEMKYPEKTDVEHNQEMTNHM